MKQFEIKITKSTRYVDFGNDNEKVGNIGENLQTMLVFSFTDQFVDGQARLEYTTNGVSQYTFLEKVGETYQTPIKSIMAQNGSIDMQLVITEGIDENEIPKFKSNVFYLSFGKSINAEVEQPEEYEEWIDIANTKLNEVENLDIEIQDSVVTITRKDGTQYSENVKGDDYEITEDDYSAIAGRVEEDLEPRLNDIESLTMGLYEDVDEARRLAKGANRCLPFDDYESMIEQFDYINFATFNIGQNVMIRTLNVPDLWIYGQTQAHVKYTYTSDEDFVNLLKTQGYVQVGHYKFAQLETQKVDLNEYAKKDEVPKVSYTYGIYKTSGGILYTDKATNTAIDNKTDNYHPIVPSNLNYAVKSVVGGHVTLTQAEYDALETIDEDTYYYIKEEE